MHSGGFELTKLTYTRLEDNLIRHRGDWHYRVVGPIEGGMNNKAATRDRSA